MKYDAQPELKLSSYDIAAVAWNMDSTALTVAPNAYLQLAKNALGEIQKFIENDALRSSLDVPNRTRKVFGAYGAKINDLVALHDELKSLIERVELERIILFSKSASLLTESEMPTWRETRPEAVRKYSY